MTRTADDFDGDINAARIHNAIDDYYDSIKDWSTSPATKPMPLSSPIGPGRSWRASASTPG